MFLIPFKPRRLLFCLLILIWGTQSALGMRISSSKPCVSICENGIMVDLSNCSQEEMAALDALSALALLKQGHLFIRADNIPLSFLNKIPSKHSLSFVLLGKPIIGKPWPLLEASADSGLSEVTNISSIVAKDFSLDTAHCLLPSALTHLELNSINLLSGMRTIPIASLKQLSALTLISIEGLQFMGPQWPTSLTFFKIILCNKLESVSGILPRSIKEVYLSHCPKLGKLPKYHPNATPDAISIKFIGPVKPFELRVKSLNSLALTDVRNLSKIPKTIPGLQDLNLNRLPKLILEPWDIPSSIKSLTCNDIGTGVLNLKCLLELSTCSLRQCTRLKSILTPELKEDGCFYSLEEMTVEDISVATLLLSHYPYLRIFEAKSLSNLEQIRLPESLDELSLSHCPKLKTMSLKKPSTADAMTSIRLEKCGLKELDLSQAPTEVLCIKDLAQLQWMRIGPICERFSIENCEQLTQLEPLAKKGHAPKAKYMRLSHCGLASLNLSNYLQLEHLNLTHLKSLFRIRTATHLNTLHLCCVDLPLFLGGLKRLTTLELDKVNTVASRRVNEPDAILNTLATELFEWPPNLHSLTIRNKSLAIQSFNDLPILPKTLCLFVLKENANLISSEFIQALDEKSKTDCVDKQSAACFAEWIETKPKKMSLQESEIRLIRSFQQVVSAQGPYELRDSISTRGSISP